MSSSYVCCALQAERFVVPDSSPHGAEWLQTWSMLLLANLPGFPLCERDIFDVLSANLESLQSIFRAYSSAFAFRSRSFFSPLRCCSFCFSRLEVERRCASSACATAALA